MSRVIKAHNLVLSPQRSPLTYGRSSRREPEPNEPRRSVAPPDSGGAGRAESEKILAAARARAERMLDDARTRAESVIEAALKGAEELAEEARSEGRRQGWEEGLARAREESDNITAEAEAVLERARADAEQLQIRCQKDMIGLAVLIAEKIVRTRVENDPVSLLPMINGALERVRGAEKAVIKVAPEVTDKVKAERGLTLASDLGIAELEVQPDPSLAPGDVVIQTELGSVDARLNRQIERISRSLQAVTGDE